MINLLCLLKTWGCWVRSLIRSRIFGLTIALLGFTFSASAQLITDYGAYLADLTNGVNQLNQSLGEFSVSLNTNLQHLGSVATNDNQKAIREIIECQGKIDDLKDVLQSLVDHIGVDSDGTTLMAFVREIRNKVSLIEGYSNIISAFFDDSQITITTINDVLNDIDARCTDLLGTCDNIYYLLNQWYDEWQLLSYNQTLYWNSVTGILEEVVDAIGGGGDGGSSVFDTQPIEDKLDDILDNMTNQVDWTNIHLYFTDWLRDVYDYDMWNHELLENSDGQLDEYDNSSFENNVGVAFNNLTRLLVEVNEGVSRLVYLLVPESNNFEEVMDTVSNRTVSAWDDGTNELNYIETNFDVNQFKSDAEQDWNSVKGFFDGLFPSDMEFTDFKIPIKSLSFMGANFDSEDNQFDLTWLLDFVEIVRAVIGFVYIILAFVAEWFFIDFVWGWLMKLWKIVDDFLSR